VEIEGVRSRTPRKVIRMPREKVRKLGKEHVKPRRASVFDREPERKESREGKSSIPRQADIVKVPVKECRSENCAKREEDELGRDDDFRRMTSEGSVEVAELANGGKDEDEEDGVENGEGEGLGEVGREEGGDGFG
jgi:hypothetical protein